MKSIPKKVHLTSLKSVPSDSNVFVFSPPYSAALFAEKQVIPYTDSNNIIPIGIDICGRAQGIMKAYTILALKKPELEISFIPPKMAEITKLLGCEQVDVYSIYTLLEALEAFCECALMEK